MTITVPACTAPIALPEGELQGQRTKDDREAYAVRFFDYAQDITPFVLLFPSFCVLGMFA